MSATLDEFTTKLTALMIPSQEAKKIAAALSDCKQKNMSPEETWRYLQKNFLTQPAYRSAHFDLHKLVYEMIYPNWDKMPAPVWFPDKKTIEETNLLKVMQRLHFDQYEQFHTWSITHYADFWQAMVEILGIEFAQPAKSVVDISKGISAPIWFPGSKLNIANSCFHADPHAIAIIEQAEKGQIKKTTYAELNQLSDSIAANLQRFLKKEDCVAIIMPMTTLAVAIYLGVVKAGCCNISIADSFAVDEIATRLRIANAKAVFTQDVMMRDGKQLPLYEKILAANAPFTVVLPAGRDVPTLREQDILWKDFLLSESTLSPVVCDPQDYLNILFSSGTTGEPKAIPLLQITPIKCASDAFLHLNIKPGDTLCWPTSLGWMMGPWSIYASLINKGTLALFNGSPTGRAFGEFIETAGVNILGIVPTLIRTWRHLGCMEGLNWESIKIFSSTGECSNIDDMLYLMSLVNYKPIIEYCGGTEIAGAYVTSTLLQPNAPSAFTTPTLGLDFVILDEEGQLTNNGEVALVPPSIGLSTELLNKDHHKVYYADMPSAPGRPLLRRHGDQIERFTNGYYRLHGRMDDTMNLGGIKVSSTEIEAVLNILTPIHEVAAIAVNPKGGGPSLLVIYVVLKPQQTIALDQLKTMMQLAVKERLNPLFKISDVVIVSVLPRTASNKLMRRILRDEYEKS